jgi:hypothetical protein
MNESGMWQGVRAGLKKSAQIHGYALNLTRLELTGVLGVPDVMMDVVGKRILIELKYLKSFPKRESTPIRIPCLTPHQRLYIKTSGTIGNNVWLLVRIDKDIFLWSWKDIYDLESWDKEQWIANCKLHLQSRFNYSKLLTALIEER